MDKKLERLLSEQNFSGKTVCAFVDAGGIDEVTAFFRKRMASKTLLNEYAPCDFFVFLAGENADLKKCFSLLRGGGKVAFLKQGKEHKKLKEKLWEEGFLITRHFSFRVTPTSGVSYSKAGDSQEFLFIVADKLGF